METYIGSIQAVGFNFAPRESALCRGQILSIASNTALFSLLGTTFGGDGRVTLGLPDLQGRTAIGTGNGPGLSTILWGERSGTESTVLGLNNLPRHSHDASFTPSGGASGVEVSIMASKKAGNTSAKDGAVLANVAQSLGLMSAYAENPDNADLVTLGGVRVQGSSSGGGTVAIGNTGSGQSFGIRNPYLGLYHTITIQGLFPSRN